MYLIKLFNEQDMEMIQLRSVAFRTWEKKNACDISLKVIERSPEESPGFPSLNLGYEQQNIGQPQWTGA